jgi:hypothetical protein
MRTRRARVLMACSSRIVTMARSAEQALSTEQKLSASSTPARRRIFAICRSAFGAEAGARLARTVQQRQVYEIGSSLADVSAIVFVTFERRTVEASARMEDRPSPFVTRPAGR